MPLAWRWMLRGFLATLMVNGLCLEVAPAALAAVNERLPSIKQIAVMPVYWQGKFPEGHPFAPLRQHLDLSFTKLARDSKRFTFTNDVITADLWSTPEGRRELAEEYEIDGLLNLSITGQADLMLWTVRLLSPAMQTYLSENERVPYAWFLAASQEEIDQRLQNLLYRLLNRYPIDVFVTSVQGRYVSLSSGSEQNIFEGDELSFYETTLKSQHPIDASWLNYEQKLLGKAKVIESKSQTSIAVITSLSFENALKAGDGARVAAIASRRPFQQVKEAEQRYVPVAKDSPIVAAPGDWQKPLAETVTPPSPPPAKGTIPSPKREKDPQEPLKLADASSQEAPQPMPNPETEAGPSSREAAPDGSEESFQDFLAASFKYVHGWAGSETLNFSGTNKLSSKTPDWFINRLGVQGTQEFSKDWQGIYGVSLRSGKSAKGGYLGFGLQGEALYQIETLNSTIKSLDRLLVGGLLRLETIGVTGETFGGWDVALLSPSVHFQGNHHLVELVQTIDYDIGLRYFLFGMGSAGIAGKKRDLGSGSALELEISAMARGRPNEIEWGAQFNYHSGAWDLSKGQLEQQFIGLNVLGRLRF